MIGIIVCGHGQFGTGIESALRLLVGDVEFLEGIDFEGSEGEMVLSDRIKEVVERMRPTFDQIFVLCDILGGSPFKCAATLYAVDTNVKILYGANLGMAVELCMRAMTGTGQVNMEMTASQLVEIGRCAIDAYTYVPVQEMHLEDVELEEEGI